MECLTPYSDRHREHITPQSTFQKLFCQNVLIDLVGQPGQEMSMYPRAAVNKPCEREACKHPASQSSDNCLVTDLGRLRVQDGVQSVEASDSSAAPGSGERLHLVDNDIIHTSHESQSSKDPGPACWHSPV